MGYKGDAGRDLLGCVVSSHVGAQTGDLRIEMIRAYHFVVDSNVESLSTYTPEAAYLSAQFCHDGANDLTDIFTYIGNFTNDTPGTYPSVTNPAVG